MPKKAREIIRTYIGLGSNVGDREAHLNDAVRDLAALGEVCAVSPFFETTPVGPAQADYLNACLCLDTALTATALHTALVAIECAHGRTRAEKWGPRTLDLDLLLYGPLVLDSETLRIPHPELHRRGFVLAPLNEIAPTALVPTQGKIIAALFAEWLMRDGKGVRRYSPCRDNN